MVIKYYPDFFSQSVNPHRLKIMRNYTRVSVQVSNFERITFREKNLYSPGYPPQYKLHEDDKDIPYDQGQCLDSCIDEQVKRRYKCHRWHRLHYQRIRFDEPLQQKDCTEKRNYKNILCVQEGFRNNKSGICGNEPLNLHDPKQHQIHDKCMGICKPYHIFDYFAIKGINEAFPYSSALRCAMETL